jgi:hypothetical protein
MGGSVRGGSVVGAASCAGGVGGTAGANRETGAGVNAVLVVPAGAALAFRAPVDVAPCFERVEPCETN